MSKEYHKQEWARKQERVGKRPVGRRPKRRDRVLIFMPWAMVLKNRRRKRKAGLVVKSEEKS